MYSKYWRNWLDFDAHRQLPPAIQYTAAEREELSGILQDLETYADENLHRFNMGLEPIEKWDSVVKQMKEGM